MKRNLIVVGNKPPLIKGLNQIIDSFDFVLRISRMNYLGEAGEKIDGIYLEANDIFKYEFKGGENKEALQQANKIFMHQHWYDRFDEWDQFLTIEQYEDIEIVNHKLATEAIQFERPTSPLLILAHILNSHWRDKYNIHITCLDVENRVNLIDNNQWWNYHKGGGVYEKRYLTELINGNIIIRVPDE